jgi:putative inorganic carbon (hco3(-)) transporter
VNTLTRPLDAAQTDRADRSWFAYAGLLIFILVYCTEPSNWIPGVGSFPFAKIAAFLAVAGFAAGLFQPRVPGFHVPREVWYLLFLFVQICLTVPFAIWRGGAFEVIVDQYWKVVLMSLIVMTAVTSLSRLHKVMFVMASSLALLGLFSIFSHHGVSEGGVFRTGGSMGGSAGNPNDFAFMLAVIFPFCLAFCLGASNPLKKLAWGASLVTVTYAIMLTYSRGGFIALTAGAAVCVYEFGIRGHRRYLLALAGFAVLGFVAVSPAGYTQRVTSIFNTREDWTGSTVARQDLFKKSIIVTLDHPLFGVGPENFPIVAGNWHVSHNTYTQLSAEAGIPALILFLLILYKEFSNIRLVKRLVPEDHEVQLAAGALRASLYAFVFGAFFASYAYNFFVYLTICLSTALYISVRNEGPIGRERSRGEDETTPPRFSYRTAVHEPSWSWPTLRSRTKKPSENVAT